MSVHESTITTSAGAVLDFHRTPEDDIRVKINSFGATVKPEELAFALNEVIPGFRVAYAPIPATTAELVRKARVKWLNGDHGQGDSDAVIEFIADVEPWPDDSDYETRVSRIREEVRR